MRRIPEAILQDGCTAYANTFLHGNGSLGEGIEAAYFEIHEHDDWVRPGPEAWTGEGLPPVGTLCLLSGKTPMLDPIHPHWAGSEVKIYAHFKTDQGRELAAYVSEDHMKGGVGVEKLFLPIRTAEQIAAEERESHINGMLCHDALGGTRRGLAEALYDAGYRKQVQP